uniref:CSON000924 protein n=1 Tax=Culicoides sonorensis TaxID=179676 RepID=A0A336MLB1_CULSO
MGTYWLLAVKWTLLSVALILFLLRDASGEKTPQMDFNHNRITRADNKGVCGRALTEMISTVCKLYKPLTEKPKRMFFGQMHPKMKVIYNPVDFDEYDDMNVVDYEMPMNQDPDIDYSGQFLKRIYNGAMIPSWKNGKRNERQSLVSECCKKHCSTSEMYGYCDGKGGFLAMAD